MLCRKIKITIFICLLAIFILSVSAQEPQQQQRETSYMPVVIKEPFSSVMSRMKAAKAGIMARQMALLNERYDLTPRVSNEVKMSRGKPIPVGPTARLASGLTWESLAAMSPEEIREKGLFPKGYLPLPHPNHPEGGMVFPKMMIDELVKMGEGNRLERFDLDFDLPEQFLPEFPPAIFLTTRSDLGDVSHGKVITLDNYAEIFYGILNPKQLEGLRLLLTQFTQQQFNNTEDRRTERPSRGVACLDCHVNGHTNGATHLVGDIRPQDHRHRLDTPSLRGVNIQRLFGSQRALRSVEDFTEFEQRAAYFDGDPVIATKKGVNPLERGSQVHNMGEMQDIFDFPPAPKLDMYGRLYPSRASQSELRGEALFFGKANCSICHIPPFYTDNLMHNLQVERFFKPQMINGLMATADGPIKTFPLRGVKESPPYLHDGRLLTLEDVVEFFNLIQELKLNKEEKADLVAFMRAL
ncbi:MAG: cytochrome B6 [Blastocatellia bacterium]|nr:cytochrome B6 [Blastocatellia bacterium]